MNFASPLRSRKSSSKSATITRLGREAGREATGKAFETLEVRQLMSAVVTTDQSDYAPGSTAQITASSDDSPGTNFVAGETVNFRVLRIDPLDGSEETLPGSQPWRVEDGTIDWFVLRGGQYEQLPVGPDGVVRSEVFPGLWLDVQALLAADLPRMLSVLQQGIDSPEHAAFVAGLQPPATQ